MYVQFKMAENNEIEHLLYTKSRWRWHGNIYWKIKEHCGQLNKESFINIVYVQYDDDLDKLNAVRQSLYGYAKSYAEHFPAGHITKRRKRGKAGKVVGEKYSAGV